MNATAGRINAKDGFAFNGTSGATSTVTVVTGVAYDVGGHVTGVSTQTLVFKGGILT